MLKSFPHDRPLVDIAKVTKVYHPNIVAIQNVSLEVLKGEMLFLTGMSGAGKTTLLKLICAIEQPTKGVVEVGGRDLTKTSSAEIQQLRQEIGVIYQDFKLLPKQTAFQNIAMPMEVAYRDQRDINHRVDQLLKLLLISHKRDIPTSKLSRGEQQRVAIARAAANSPALILADEPTGNLDPETSGLVMKLFEQLNREGTTLIIASHDVALYRNTDYRRVELEHGLFTNRSSVRQLPLPTAGSLYQSGEGALPPT